MATPFDFVRQFSKYSLGVVLHRLTSLFLLPLYTRHLSPQDYGILDVMMTVVALFQPLFMLGMDTSLQILFFKREEGKERDILISTCFATVCIFATLCSLIGMYFAPVIVQILGQKEELTFTFRLLCFDMWLSSLFVLFRNTLRVRQQPFLFNLVSVGQVILMAGFNIVFVALWDLGLSGIIMGLVLSDLIATLFAGLLVLRRHWQFPAFDSLKPLLQLGLPLLPTSLCYWLLNLSDRFFLLKLSTLHEVGIYGIANRLAAAMGIFTIAIQLSWRPFALRIQDEVRAPQVYAAIPLYYFALVGWVGLVVAASSPLLLKIFAAPAYGDAAALLTPLLLAQVMYGAYYIFSTGIEITQKTYHLSWTIACAAVINVLLNFLLIPHIGAKGASVATLFSYTAAAFAVCAVSHRLYPLNYDRPRGLAIGLVLLVAYGMLTVLFWVGSKYLAALGAACVIVSALAFLYILKAEVRGMLSRFNSKKSQTLMPS